MDIRLRIDKRDIKIISDHIASRIISHILEHYDENIVSPQRRPQYPLIYTGKTVQMKSILGKRTIRFYSPAINFIEYGTSRHTGNGDISGEGFFDRIRKWAKLKLNIQRKDVLDKVAWGLYKKISALGTKDYYPVRGAIRQTIEDFSK
jgi:hypothetical protein